MPASTPCSQTSTSDTTATLCTGHHTRRAMRPENAAVRPAARPAYSPITPRVTGTGRYDDPSGTNAPHQPTPAYLSVASTTTCSTVNTRVNTDRLTCTRMRVADEGRRQRARAGCESTSPNSTSPTSSRYDVMPAARPRIQGAILSPAIDCTPMPTSQLVRTALTVTPTTSPTR